METARIDIRKLQLLNDRIHQTLEALNQVRLTVHGVQTDGLHQGYPGYGASYGYPGVHAGFGYGVPSHPFGMQPQYGFGFQDRIGFPFGWPQQETPWSSQPVLQNGFARPMTPDVARFAQQMFPFASTPTPVAIGY